MAAARLSAEQRKQLEEKRTARARARECDLNLTGIPHATAIAMPILPAGTLGGRTQRKKF